MILISNDFWHVIKMYNSDPYYCFVGYFYKYDSRLGHVCDCQKTERRETEEKEYHLKNKVHHKIINERNTRMQQINRTDWFSLKLTVREKAKLVIPHRKALRHKHAFIKQSLKHVCSVQGSLNE